MAIKSIDIYTTHTCPFCKMEKAFLDDNSVKYNEYFVDDDDDKKAEMVNVSGQMGTPVTVVEFTDGEKRQFVGFDQKKLKVIIDGDKAGDPLVQEN